MNFTSNTQKLGIVSHSLMGIIALFWIQNTILLIIFEIFDMVMLLRCLGLILQRGGYPSIFTKGEEE